MKIAVYDKYWDTMGGGEKYGGAIASYLSREHEIDLVAVHRFDKEALASRLGLDLSNVNVKYIEELPENDLAKEFADYDILINNTFYSRMPSMAKQGVLIVFFPEIKSAKVPIFIKKMLKFLLHPLFKDYGKDFEYREGIYWNEVIKGRSGRWTSGSFTIYLKKPFSKFKLRFDTFRKIKNMDTLFKKVTINGKDVNFVVRSGTITVYPGRKVSKEDELCFEVETFNSEEERNGASKPRDLGIFLENTVVDSSSIMSKILFVLWGVPLLRRLISLLYSKYIRQVEFFMDPDFVDTYDLVVTISDYSKKWTEDVFSVDTFKLIPPIDTDEFQEGRKKKQVLSVGRFFVGSHNKKQLEMIRAFKKMYDEYEDVSDFEYHLCGGTHSEPIHQKYLEKCKKEAKGYPIHIHTDVSFEELKNYYAESLIFWHGSGWGENPNIDPVKFEHFGITTAESMAAGCIPIVIGMAGQKEVVQDGVNGFLWISEDELINKTLKVVRSKDLREELKNHAKKRVEEISFDSFFNRVDEMTDLLQKDTD